jgi:hypothetical protein
MLKNYRVRSDVWMVSTDVWQQALRWKACPARAASTTRWGTPVAVATTIPNDNRPDVSDADSSNSSDLLDPGSHATGATAAASTSTSTSIASADAADAKRQGGGVMRGHPPVFAQSADPMDVED